MGFVFLCLIFFLCKTGMDSRFQLRLLFHCFQGLFLRSHMGYCDECTPQGVFSEHTSNQRAKGRCCPHCATTGFLSWGQHQRVHCKLPIAPDNHPESLVKPGGLGGGQKLKTGWFSKHNFVRHPLTTGFPTEYICFPCLTSIISVAGESKTGVLNKLSSVLIWGILNQEAHVLIFASNVY